MKGFSITNKQTTTHILLLNTDYVFYCHQHTSCIPRPVATACGKMKSSTRVTFLFSINEVSIDGPSQQSGRLFIAARRHKKLPFVASHYLSVVLVIIPLLFLIFLFSLTLERGMNLIILICKYFSPMFIISLSYSSTCFEPYCAHHQEGLLYIHSIWFFVTAQCTGR